MNSLRVAVLFGGVSEEREVSVASGAQVYNALEKAGHDVVAIDSVYGALGSKELEKFLIGGVAPEPPQQKNLSLLRQQTAGNLTRVLELITMDVVFITLHGGSGEDGTIQAFFDLAGIPYTGSGHSASALAMDKDISKHLFRAAGISTPDWQVVSRGQTISEPPFPCPFVVKSNKQGSTVGLTVVKKLEAFQPALRHGFLYDDEVIIETFIPGREFTVGILDNNPLAVGEIIPQQGEIFDYQSKYQPGGAQEIFPAKLSSEQSQHIQELGLRVHHALKLSDYSRADFRIDPEGRAWCLEANTVPGLTSTSLLPQSAQAVGISFPQLCDKICRLAIQRHQKNR